MASTLCVNIMVCESTGFCLTNSKGANCLWRLSVGKEMQTSQVFLVAGQRLSFFHQPDAPFFIIPKKKTLQNQSAFFPREFKD